MSLFYILEIFYTEGLQFQSFVTSAIVVRTEKYYFVPIIFYFYTFIFTEVDLRHRDRA